MKVDYKKYLIFLNLLLLRIFCKKSTLVKPTSTIFIAPHPDDEILGLGGFILKMLDNGNRIHIVYLTDGEGSAVWPDKEEIRRNRIALSEKVCNLLGLEPEDVTRLHLADGAVPHTGETGFNEVVEILKQLISKLKPDAVFATHILDFWPFDHVACANMAKEAVCQSDHKPELWYYWVWAWYNLRPWKLSFSSLKKLQKVNISDQMSRKKDLMNIYLKAYTPDGRPWSGILPESFLKAFKNDYEILERIF